MTLAEQHEKMLLEESGISPEVIEARGYRTVEDPEELLSLGFQPYQAITPGLHALLAQPNSLPAGEALVWIVSWILPPIIGLQVFYILLFPNGRLPSRRWRPLAWLTVAFILERVMNSISNGLGMRKTENRKGTKPTVKSAFLCDFHPSS